MDFLKREWMTVVGFAAIFVSIYIMALKLNQVVRAHNDFVIHTQQRLDALELKAALWERQVNEGLAQDSRILGIRAR